MKTVRELAVALGARQLVPEPDLKKQPQVPREPKLELELGIQPQKLGHCLYQQYQRLPRSEV